jgi:hypothetical protein
VTGVQTCALPIFDDTSAREDWGWHNDFDLSAMTKDMLDNLK